MDLAVARAKRALIEFGIKYNKQLAIDFKRLGQAARNFIKAYNANTEEQKN